MLHEVDQSIRNLLAAELRMASPKLVSDDAQIVIGAPSDLEQGKLEKPRVRLFLHDIHENLAVRDQGYEITRAAGEMQVGKSLKPTRLNLSYLLTVEAEKPEAEHQLLGEALGVLMRNGFIPTRYLEGSLTRFGEEAISISVGQRDHWAHMDAPKVWQATGLPLRPFIGIVASALFDPYETRTVKLVREALFSMGQGVRPAGPDRQMDVRSVRVSAAGAITDENGEPLPDVVVSIHGRGDQTLTDAQGVFLFRNLPSGPHRLAFRKRGFEDAETEAVAPPRGLANELQPVAVQLKAASAKGLVSSVRSEFQERAKPTTLIGTLRYSDGRPASFIPVRIGERTAVTDQEGVYHFTDVASGQKSVVAEVPGRGEVVAPVAADGVAEVPKK